MKILVAPDSFKGSLSAVEVAESIKKGILAVCPDLEIINVPLADGGEGTVKAMVSATKGEIKYCNVTGPLGDNIKSYYGILGDNKTAVIEMAAASGLTLIPFEKADPSKTTTYGTGQLIKYALEEDVEKIIIGIGGSATNDGGMGMAQALGVKFYDMKKKELKFGGKELARLCSIDTSGIDDKLKKVKIEIACDVNNPLYGSNGAAYVYGSQKGADANMIKQLDNNLRHLSKVIEKKLGKIVHDIPGAGAAGGLGAGLIAFLDAKLKPGINIIMEATGIYKRMNEFDLVFTGEGQIDGQTINGKAPIGIAQQANKFNIPVIGIGGSIGENAKYVLENGIDAIFSIINRPVCLDEAQKNTSEWLQLTTSQIISLAKKFNYIN